MLEIETHTNRNKGVIEMISQRGINRIPEFILPPTAIKSSRTIKDVWLEIPMFYKKLVVSIIAIFLGAVSGAITPWLTQTLEGLF